MKKLQFLFLFLLTFLFLQKTNAQWSVTPSLGVNNANIVYGKTNFDKSLYNFRPRNAVNYLMGGVTAKYNFTKKYAAEFGVQFSQKGYQGTGFIDGKNTKLKIQYYELMPAFEYSPFSFLSFYTGLNIGIKSKELSSIDSEPYKPLFINTIGVFIANPIDFGGLIGARLKYKKIQLGIHANRSLIPTSKYTQTDNNGEIIGDVKEFHRVFQLSLGYQINVKHK